VVVVVVIRVVVVMYAVDVVVAGAGFPSDLTSVAVAKVVDDVVCVAVAVRVLWVTVVEVCVLLVADMTVLVILDVVTVVEEVIVVWVVVVKVEDSDVVEVVFVEDVVEVHMGHIAESLAHEKLGLERKGNSSQQNVPLNWHGFGMQG